MKLSDRLRAGTATAEEAADMLERLEGEGWCYDMSEAPTGYFDDVRRTVGKTIVMSHVHVPETIIAAGNGGVVTLSKWIEKEQRWSMFTKDCPPIAWRPWPKHPDDPEARAFIAALEAGE